MAEQVPFIPAMNPKRFLALALFAWLAAAPAGEARAQWVQTNGLQGEYINSLLTDGTNLLAGSYSDGLFLSSDFGRSWFPDTFGLENPCINSLLNDDSTVFCTTPSVGGNGWGVFRSNNGISWVNVDSGLPQINLYGLGDKDSSLFVGTYLGIWRSKNNGQWWESTSEGLSLDPTSYVSSFGVMDSIIYTGTYGNGVFRSSDDGDNWVPVNNGLPDGALIKVLAVSNKSLFAGTYDDGIYFLSEHDTNWKAANEGMTNKAIISLLVDGDNIFVSTVGGVFLSSNNGTTWADVSSGLNSEFYVYSLGVVDSFLFAGTWGSGVYRRPLSEMIPSPSAVTEAPPVINAIHSYPNPFSQSTEIAFTSATAGYADVWVVNILGAPVAHLFSGELAAGEHDFAWDAQGMAPGSYWCVVRMGDSVERIALLVER